MRKQNALHQGRPPKQTRFPKTGTEQSRVKPKVRKLLDKHGWYRWPTPATKYGLSGVSDTLAVKMGMFIAVESKFSRNDPTTLQKQFLGNIRAQQHFAFVVRETTLDAFATFLEYLDQSIAWVAAGKGTPPAEIGGPLTEAIRVLTETEVLKK